MQERNSQTLLRFFTELNQDTELTHVFLLGDIFDLWVADHQVFISRYSPLLEQIRALTQKGLRVIYFEGNHDMHLQNYWTENLHVEVYTSAQVFELSDIKVRCEHGDQMNLQDLAYLRLRKFLRHPVTKFFGNILPGKFWDLLGQRWSNHSRAQGQNKKNKTESIIEVIRAHATTAYQETPYDLLVTGHMHVRDDWSTSIKDKKIRSINLGTWLEQPGYLILANQKIEWKAL
jgi:UDP-2,3-diacylglucosamine hydrolase